MYGFSRSWRFGRSAHQYVIEVPSSIVSKPWAAGVLHRVKLARKLPGVLRIQYVIPGVSAMYSLNPSPNHYLMIHAVDHASAFVAIAHIDAILSQASGQHITRVVQRVPSAQARFVWLRRTNQTICPDVALPARTLGGFFQNRKEGAFIFSTKPVNALLLAIQRTFELNGIPASRLGLAKLLVWRCLGGQLHAVGVSMRWADDLLRGTIVVRLPFYKYAPLLSVRFPHQRESALQMVEQGSGVGLWVDSIEAFCDGSFRSETFFLLGHLTVCGKRIIVDLALERIRVFRASGFPECIVIREASWIHQDNHAIVNCQLAFGSHTHVDMINIQFENLECFHCKLCCWGCFMGRRRRVPRDREQLKQVVAALGVVAIGDFTDFSAQYSIVGGAVAVSKALRSLQPFVVGEEVQVNWRNQWWPAVILGCSGLGMRKRYELVDPNNRWSSWMAWPDDLRRAPLEFTDGVVA